MPGSSDLWRIDLPINELTSGEIAPPLEPEHGSWTVLQGWDDPLAPRAGFRVPSLKECVQVEGRAAIHFARTQSDERAMTAKGPWRELTIECEMQALQREAGPTNDDWMVAEARAGLTFRGETVRRNYYLCIEGMRRLVLYRRIDQEWHELASEQIEYDGETVTLAVHLDGDGIQAHCRELDVTLMATDTMIASGHAGFRALGEARLLSLSIICSASQQAVNDRRASRRTAALAAASAALPGAVPAGELRMPQGFSLADVLDLRAQGRHDLLLRGSEGLLATDWDGNELWRLPGRVGTIKMCEEAVDGSRRLYVLTGGEASTRVNVHGAERTAVLASRIVALDPATGEKLAQVELPDDPDRDRINIYDFSAETGRLSGDRPGGFLVRQWRTDLGNGGDALWAFDADLQLLWHTKVSPPYGHHWAVRLCDLTGDGRPEIIAGGTTLAADGTVIARHDLAHEMDLIRGAHHYDAVAVGSFSEDPERDPVAFLVSGSAGVYVIDPLTGRTRAVHRVGHAQGQQLCRLRDDIPGRQVLVSTRWANFGIFTLFSGLGERLWSIQPGHLPRGCPVQWLPEGPQHLWAHAGRESLALYDGRGRQVLSLDALADAWGDRFVSEVGCSVVRRSPDGRDLLALTIDDRVLLFGPEP
ncbi:MAG: hypothetical protein ACOX9R_03360 [Armatimonadota bacterium]